MALLAVTLSSFNATSTDNHHPANPLTLVVGATLTALAVGSSLFYCRMRAHPLPGKAHPLPAHFELGQEAFQRGDFEQAVGHYENALSFQQVSSEKIYYERGRVYLEMKDCSAAWEDCKKALTKLQDARSLLDPPVDPNLSAQALCLKAELCLVQNQPRNAIEECQKILTQSTDSKILFQIYLILAVAYYNSKNYAVAMEHCNKAISHNTNQAMGIILLYNQAMCFIRQGNPQPARNSLEWAKVGLDALTFPASFLRLVMPLPSEWRVNIDTILSPSQQFKQKVIEAFNRTNPS